MGELQGRDVGYNKCVIGFFLDRIVWRFPEEDMLVLNEKSHTHRKGGGERR
jgi:hypothetical protein